MGLEYVRAGPVLWAAIAFTAVGLLKEQYSRWRAKQPFRSQPVQGARYAVLAGHFPSSTSQLRLPLMIQVFCFLGLLFSLISPWCVGGFSYTLFDRQFHLPFSAPARFSGYYSGYVKYRIDDAFTIVASNWTTVIFSLLALILNVCQIISLIKLRRHTFEPAQQAMVHAATTPGVWARAYLLLVLHYSLILMYGILVCAWGGFAPSTGYYTALLVTFLTRVQSDLIAEYIRSLPPPHPGGVVGFPQCIPGQPGLGGVNNGLAVGAAVALPQVHVPVREVEMNVVQAQAVQQPGQNPYYSLPQGPSAHPNWPAVSAPYYHPQAAYASPVVTAPLLARVPHQVEGAAIASRLCPNCNTFATGAGVFCSACGTRL